MAVAAAKEEGTGAPGGRRTRNAVSVVMVLLASVAAGAGGVTLYMREEVLNTSAFADRAVDAIHQPGLSKVMAREIAVQVVEPGAPDLVAARPVIESALRSALGAELLSPVVRLAAEHGHRLLFERSGGNAVFDLVDAGTVVSSALRTLAPRVARQIPARTEAVLLTLRRRSFAAVTLRAAETVRIIGILLPIAAVLLFGLGIAIAPDRRRAITRSGIALSVVAVAAAITLEVVRRYVVSHVYGSDELTNADVRGAVGDLWGAYFGDLLTWTLGVAVVAGLMAATAAPLFAPYAPGVGLRRLARFASRPQSTRMRAWRGALILALGLFAIVNPSLGLTVAGVIGGCLLVYIGAGELLTATAPVEPRVQRRRRTSRQRAVSVGLVGAAVSVGVVLAFAFTGVTRRVQARGPLTCNGYAQLCSRRLDEVVLAGTHNSMSAADSPGWLIANQDRDVSQQLQDGIRLFKVSTHYGVKSPSGWVSTDIAAEGNRLNRVAAKLPAVARESLQRLSRTLSRGSSNGKRDIWLCHTLCELGATRMVGFLSAIRRFLELNPGQVVVLFDEDYVAEADLQKAFQRAGLYRRLATLQPGQPLPTLGDLIRSQRNLLVLAQKPTSGKYTWNPYAFDWVQDTPLGTSKPSEFTCKLNRGKLSNPLLMMNNWADVFPPRPTPNLPLNQRNFILERAQQCLRQRGRIPNLILTDYYNRGTVIKAVAELNGVGNVKPAETVTN